MLFVNNLNLLLLIIIIIFDILTRINCFVNYKKDTCDLKNLIYSNDGDLKVGFLINDCNNSSDKSRLNTYVNSAIYTKDRINSLLYTKPFKFGISIYEVCLERDYYNTLYDLFKQNDERFLLGVINLMMVPKKAIELSNVLDVPMKYTYLYWLPLVKSSVKLLNVLNWKSNVTVISTNFNVLQEFHRYTRRDWICVKKAILFEKNVDFLDVEGPAVLFGNNAELSYITNKLIYEQGIEQEDLIIVPFDGIQPDAIPYGSYIIRPSLMEPSYHYTTSSDLFYTPLFFEISNPILTLAKNISKFILDNCNETLFKYNCLSNKLTKYVDNRYGEFTPTQILSELKLNTESKFNYNVFKIESIQKNYSITKLSYVYNMFNEEMSIADVNMIEYNETNFMNGQNICMKHLERCLLECVNFKTPIIRKGILLPNFSNNVRLRTESWVFAFLSISFLGCLFALSILFYILVRMCKRDTFEGNPLMTIFLLITVIWIYCSVIPFSLEGNKVTRHTICVARILSLTLSYAFAFSLLLSRCILLATSSKEIGFMSHVSGPVQSFLCLFMFGIQCALSLQVINHCAEIFKSYTLILLLSYNIFLLLLLVCIAPLVTRSQRNYREGKYFTVAIIIITLLWCLWIPGYMFLDYELKDPLLCLGLVTTASIFVATVFIPRTYLITIAIARDRLTSALPSLGTANSTLDMYRANLQPVYDCVNVAAINANNSVKNNLVPPPPPQPDLYSCPTLPEDDDNFEIRDCDSPAPDKVTRF